MELFDSTLLVTGGTGSFGTAVLSRYAGRFREIRVLSRGVARQDELKKTFPNVKFVAGDVADRNAVDGVMRGVDVVFAAAALKDIPGCEKNPEEAMRTNVDGVANVIDSAITNGVSRVVALSTDKACEPACVLGRTKAMMERYLLDHAREIGESGSTALMLTRYGNVLGSRGSVVPLFISQLHEGKTITVTDPEMVRSMMTIDDAVDLVMHAAEFGRNGELFIHRSPEATIATLARAVIDIWGEGKGEIAVIGARPGEKRRETMLTESEMARAVRSGRFIRVLPEFAADHSAVRIDDIGSRPLLSSEEMRELLLSAIGRHDDR